MFCIYIYTHSAIYTIIMFFGHVAVFYYYFIFTRRRRIRFEINRAGGRLELKKRVCRFKNSHRSPRSVCNTCCIIYNITNSISLYYTVSL